MLWNEPNHQGLLLPQWEPDGTTPASPRIYRAMVRAGYASVKAVRKKVMVLIGNTSSTGGKRGVGPVAPLEFLRRLACVDVRLRPLTTPDCANYTMLPGRRLGAPPVLAERAPVAHERCPPSSPATSASPTSSSSPRRCRSSSRRAGLAPADRNIYLTEFGYETKGVPGRPRVDERTQARWLTWAEYLADKIPTIRSFAQFLLRDQPPAPERVSASNARPFGEYSTGLLLADGKDKIAAKTFLAGLFVQKRSEGRVLLYGRLRLGPGIKLISVQRQRPRHRWETIDKLSIDGRSAFTRTIKHPAGSQYRLGYPSPAGPRTTSIAIKPVPATVPVAGADGEDDQAEAEADARRLTPPRPRGLRSQRCYHLAPHANDFPARPQGPQDAQEEARHARTEVRQGAQEEGRRSPAPRRLHARLHDDAEEAELRAAQGRARQDHRLDRGHRLHPR